MALRIPWRKVAWYVCASPIALPWKCAMVCLLACHAFAWLLFAGAGAILNSVYSIAFVIDYWWNLRNKTQTLQIKDGRGWFPNPSGISALELENTRTSLASLSLFLCSPYIRQSSCTGGLPAPCCRALAFAFESWYGPAVVFSHYFPW